MAKKPLQKIPFETYEEIPDELVRAADRLSNAFFNRKAHADDKKGLHREILGRIAFKLAKDEVEFKRYKSWLPQISKMVRDHKKEERRRREEEERIRQEEEEEEIRKQRKEEEERLSRIPTQEKFEFMESLNKIFFSDI